MDPRLLPVFDPSNHSGNSIGRTPRRRPRAWRFKRLVGAFLIVLSIASILSIVYSPDLLTSVGEGSNCTEINNPARHQTVANRIALIDGLSREFPDSGFIQYLNTSAIQAGQGFDYYPTENATVSFFANLPNYGYSIVILRTHGSLSAEASVISTSEPYSESRWVGDQLTGRLTTVEVNNTRWFALTPEFITQETCGRFSGTLVLAMFCNGAWFGSLADAFIGKGASSFIGWNRLVTVSHTDLAFEQLVKLLVEGNNVASSVQAVNDLVGPDPAHGATLEYYPSLPQIVPRNTSN